MKATVSMQLARQLNRGRNASVSNSAFHSFNSTCIRHNSSRVIWNDCKRCTDILSWTYFDRVKKSWQFGNVFLSSYSCTINYHKSQYRQYYTFAGGNMKTEYHWYLLKQYSLVEVWRHLHQECTRCFVATARFLVMQPQTENPCLNSLDPKK